MSAGVPLEKWNQQARILRALLEGAGLHNGDCPGKPEIHRTGMKKGRPECRCKLELLSQGGVFRGASALHWRAFTFLVLALPRIKIIFLT